MNTTAKGTRYEKKCIDSLPPGAWPYRWRTFRSRFQDLDFFGIGDVVVSDGKTLRIIQVKFGAARDGAKMLSTLKLAKSLRVQKELWVWKDGKKFKGWERRIVE